MLSLCIIFSKPLGSERSPHGFKNRVQNLPVYNVLENDCTIVLAHPKYVKASHGKKTDKKDAKWIADLFSIKQKESYAELSRDLRYPCLRHLRQTCLSDTG